MSDANVNLVRSIYAAWQDGRSASDFIAEDIAYENPPYAVEPGTRHGLGSFARIRDAYDDVAVKPHRFVDAGDDVIVLATISGAGFGGSVPVNRGHAYVWTVRDGQAIRFRWFHSEAEALAAAGLT